MKLFRSAPAGANPLKPSIVLPPGSQVTLAPLDHWDEAGYLALYPDVADAVRFGLFTSGLQHFRVLGRAEGRKAGTPLGWDEDCYLLLHPDVLHAVRDGQLLSGYHHYETTGRAEGRRLMGPSPEHWDEPGYLALNPDVAEAVESGLFSSGFQHFEAFGRSEGRRAGTPAGWDEDSYLLIHPDVFDAVQDGRLYSGYEHYETQGRTEGRRLPVSVPEHWDEAGYLALYPDVADAIRSEQFSSGFQHFDVSGRAEGRRAGTPAGWDEDSYLLIHSDVFESVQDRRLLSGYQHYETNGRAEGRRLPSLEPDDWDEAGYLALYPDAAEAVRLGQFRSGYQHFDIIGRLQGRKALPRWLGDALRSVSSLEPKLFPSGHFMSALREYVISPGSLGQAYADFLATVKDRTFTHVFLLPWLKRGGADLVSLHHICALQRHFDASVLVITTENAASPWRHRLPPEVALFELGAHIEGISKDKQIHLLMRIMLKVKPKVVHNINSALGWDAFERHPAALKSNSSLFVSLFAFGYSLEGEPVGHVRRLEKVYPNIQRVFTDNAFISRSLRDMYGFRKELFFQFRYPAPATARFQHTRRVTKKVLWAGRFDREKRPDILKRIIDQTPEISYHIYGDPTLDSPLQSAEFLKALKSAPNVRLFGAYDGFDSIPLDDYMLFLYTTESDGLPNVVLEALGSGLPVLAPDVGGISEVVPPETGFLLPDFADVDGFVEALRRVSSDPKLAWNERERALNMIRTERSMDAFLSRLAEVPDYVLRAGKPMKDKSGQLRSAPSMKIDQRSAASASARRDTQEPSLV